MDDIINQQLKLWRSEFGWQYAERNNNCIAANDQRRLVRDWGKILTHAINPQPENALEIGCNIGRNILALRNLIADVRGIEPNQHAVEFANKLFGKDKFPVQAGDGFNLPFDDNTFDLVFTSGVLIHVSPDDLKTMTNEIMRVSRQYIVCIEYFSHTPEQISYHGKNGFLFKRDFGRFYLEHYQRLKVLDYGFLWQPFDSSDDSNWWLFEKI
ncbi:pseudaminic acid biosynthesis-associated methylase [Desulfobacterota bacterium M19]